MSDDNKYQNDEFDENYDDLDFDDSDLSDDDAGLYDDIPEDDFEAESFDDEWDETDGGEEQTGRKGKKEKSLYTDTSDRKGFGLSFNTMVIIGALLLGGSVMAYTVMSKTAQVTASKGDTFRSSLNISSVLDGTIFGSKEDSAAAAPSDQPVPEQTQQTDTSGGFLDNTDGVAVLDENQPVDAGVNPPMPSPITPMPDEVAEQVPVIGAGDDQVPRGPEETPAVESPSVEMSAQDILNQMKASRENRVQEEDAVATIEPQKQDALSPEPIIDEVVETPAPAVEPAPAVVADSAPSAQNTAELESATRKAADAEAQVETMRGTITGLQSQVQKLESELGALRGSQTRESSDLEKTVATLQSELKEAKAAAARAEKSSQEEASRAAKAAADAKAAKDRAVKAEEAAKKAAAQKPPVVVAEKTVKADPPPRKTTPAAKPAVPETSAPAASGQWELRAAQPGRAWVSKPGARDMQGVTIGENLPGIGRITAITYTGGRWVVQGTQGQILQ